MRKLSVLESDRLTLDLSNEFYEKNKGLSRSNPQEYHRQLKIYVETGRINKIYEFSVNGRNGKEIERAKDEKTS